MTLNYPRLIPSKNGFDCESSRFVPSSIQSVKNISNGNPGDSGPFTNGFFRTGENDKSIRAFIASLLDPRRPSAVVWRIMAVVVTALYGMINRRTITHIGNEVCKPVIPHPSRTYFYASASVSIEVLALSISTTPNHLGPYSVFWCVCLSVLGAPLLKGVILKASARLRMTIAQMICHNSMFFAAIAEAIPECSPANIFGFVYYEQSSESTTGKFVCHAMNYNCWFGHMEGISGGFQCP